MTETHSEVNRGWFFPASIIKLYDEGILNSGEIILLGIINSLCHVEKGCWASNSYLAEKWGKTPFHTSRAIGKFLSLELLETEIKKGNRRVIWPTFAGDRLLKRAIAVAKKSNSGCGKEQGQLSSTSLIKENNCGGKGPSTNGFLENSETIVTPFIKKTVAKLETFIRLSRRLDRRFNRSKWYREIELLLQEVDGDKKRIIKALRAYIELVDIKELRPIVDSAASFREKFDKVERYVEKHEHRLPPPEPIVNSAPQKVLKFKTEAERRAYLDNLMGGE